MKWKRQEPGLYTSGKYRIEGTGTNWDLHYGKKHLHSGSSKKECQLFADDTEENPNIEPEPYEPPKAQKKSKTELDSVLASFRLEVDQLAGRVSSLDTTISKLTDAVLILGKAVNKLGKK